MNASDTPWVGVQSSNLVAVRWYIREDQVPILEVRFNTRSYRYYGVPEHVYRGLMSASSKGTYHHRYIKWNYPFDPI